MMIFNVISKLFILILLKLFYSVYGIKHPIIKFIVFFMLINNPTLNKIGKQSKLAEKNKNDYHSVFWCFVIKTSI